MSTFSSILLVDDEKDIREVIEQVLGDLSQKYYQASDGIAALKIITEHKVEFVVTDLAMPHMNGFELIRKIRAAGNNVPILVLTGHADKLVAHNLKSFGHIGFLSKPFQNDDLSRLILRIVGSTSQSDPIAS